LRHVRLVASDTTAARRPQNITFFKHNFDSVGTVASENILLGSNVAFTGVHLVHCRHDVGVIVRMANGVGGTATQLVRWSLIAPDISTININAPTHFLDVHSSHDVAGTRLSDCYLELAGLAINSYGDLDGLCVLKNAGSFTLGSGVNKAQRTTATGLLVQNGAVATPSLASNSYTTTGLSWPATNTLAISANAGEKMRVDANGVGIGMTPTSGNALYLGGNLLVNGATSAGTAGAVAEYWTVNFNGNVRKIALLANA
jgi:hypothetical protein